jgi:receptor protein-tyrosine kinase
MSRVHDALRRAETEAEKQKRHLVPVPVPGPNTPDLLAEVQEIPYTPAPGAFLLDPGRPSDAYSEEFRSLRTRLNHLQKLQPIHTVVVSSSCPAEGKSFTAINLALTEAQLKDNPTLLADFDFRRPVLHNTFQFDRSPGASDVLLGKASISAAIRKIEGTNLYLMPAGSPVLNPLELLHLPETKALLDQLRLHFNWVFLDTPPLLFAADANLLATITDGIILVVRLGVTTIDSVTRAIQSLCENNVLGIVANGARAGQVYSKYNYYYSGYYYKEKSEKSEDAQPA